MMIRALYEAVETRAGSVFALQTSTGFLAFLTQSDILFAVSLFSGLMLICINWAKFEQSKPVRALAGWFKR